MGSKQRAIIVVSMKKLAVSCGGYGRGSAVRAAALGQILSRDYQISLWGPGERRSLLRRSLPSAEIHDLPAYDPVFSQPDLNLTLSSLKNNISTALRSEVIIKNLQRELAEAEVEGVLCDSEPFLSRAASALGLPVVHVSHTSVVNRFELSGPDALWVQGVSGACSLPGNHRIITSFYGGDVGLILPRQIRKAPITTTDEFLVTLGGEGGRRICRLLEMDGIPYRYLPPEGENSFDEYAAALTRCRGIISAGGHQQMAEGIYCGKPLLAFPREGRWEDQLNAEMLYASGWGTLGRRDEWESSLFRFVRRIGRFPRRPSRRDIPFSREDDTAFAARRALVWMMSRRRQVS